MKIIPTILLLTSLSCSAPDNNSKEKESFVGQSDTSQIASIRFNLDKGSLTGNTIDLVVNYGAIACSCAQWYEIKSVNDTINGRQYFYLEQGRQGIINADTLFNGTNLPIQLALTGQFYSKAGYPKNYKPLKGNPRTAKVFRYESINIIKIGE